MSSGVHTVLEKLAAIAGLGGSQHHLKYTPLSFLEEASRIATHGTSAAISIFQKSTKRYNCLARDLFSFLLRLPDWINDSICSLDGQFPSEPLRSWDEPVSHPFWQLAAVVQDVWEHKFGPEALSDKRVFALLDKIPMTHVLDFGAGVGYFAFELARRNISVTCVEQSRVKREFLRHRLAKQSRTEVSMRARSRLYDVALALNVFDHLRDPVPAVRKVAARLRQGGILVFRADFPEDSWHRGGHSIRAGMYKELMRYFQHSNEHRYDSIDETFVLIRQKRPTRRVTPRRVRLHPGTTVRPVPNTRDCFVLTAPRFYIRPLVLTNSGIRLANLCREGGTLNEICRLMSGENISKEEVFSALSEMWSANLIIPDADAQARSLSTILSNSPRPDPRLHRAIGPCLIAVCNSMQRKVRRCSTRPRARRTQASPRLLF